MAKQTQNKEVEMAKQTQNKEVEMAKQTQNEEAPKVTKYRLLTAVKTGGKIREAGTVMALPEGVAAELLAHQPPYAEPAAKKASKAAAGDHMGATEGEASE